MSGNYIITPISADLIHDTKLLGSMSPYIIAKAGTHRFVSTVSEKGGKHPTWTDKWQFTRSNEHELHFEILNKRNIGADDVIGNGKIDLNSIQIAGKFKHNIHLFFNKQPAGNFVVEVQYAPSFSNSPVSRELILRLQGAVFEKQFLKRKCPYVQISVSGKILISSIHQNGHSNPIWKDEMQFIRDAGDSIQVEVLHDKKLMGSTVISHDFLNKFPGGPLTLPLMKQNQNVGVITIEIFPSNVGINPFAPPPPNNPYNVQPNYGGVNPYAPTGPNPYIPNNPYGVPAPVSSTTVTKEIIISPTTHGHHRNHHHHHHSNEQVKEVVITQTTTTQSNPYIPPPAYGAPTRNSMNSSTPNMNSNQGNNPYINNPPLSNSYVPPNNSNNPYAPPNYNNSNPYVQPLNTSNPYAPPVNSSNPYAPPSNSSNPYAPPVNSSNPYAPPVNSSNPYAPNTGNSSNLYAPPVNSSNPYTPPVNSSNPYAPPVNSSNPYAPPVNSSNPYAPEGSQPNYNYPSL